MRRDWVISARHRSRLIDPPPLSDEDEGKEKEEERLANRVPLIISSDRSRRVTEPLRTEIRWSRDIRANFSLSHGPLLVESKLVTSA